MSPIFLVFLSMLALFLLLTIAAVVRSAWHIFHPSVSTAADGVPKMINHPRFGDVLLLVGVATAWYSVAGVWLAQSVIYPNYADLAPFGPEVFQTFGRNYLTRLPSGLIPVGMMCLAWALSLWFPCRNVSRRTIWIIVALCVAFIAVTPFAAMAQEQMLDQGFSETVYARLMWSNLIRSVLFTAIGLLSLLAVRSRWSATAIIAK